MDIVDGEGLREAAQRALSEDPAGAFSYGTSGGYGPLREWIADRHEVGIDHVMVTNGSMQAAAFLFDALVSSGTEVVIERPTYDRTLLSLRDRGAVLHPVTVQDDGIDIDELERRLQDGASPRFAHVIPNFHNPAGCTLSTAKRERLLELARRHDFLVFEDDPYTALRFEGDSPSTMLAQAPDRVVYASSFSKTVCPGVRVGYLVGEPELMEDLRGRATNTYISPSMVAQAMVNDFCRSGAIDRSIATVREALRERAQTLAAALGRELPDARFTQPEGGYFLWVTLPESADVSALFDAAAERGVAIVKGTDFVLDGGKNTFRLAYSGVTPDEIEEGVRRLAEAARSVGIDA
jgi:DNA-binding transcriptional MocR family regulator